MGGRRLGAGLTVAAGARVAAGSAFAVLLAVALLAAGCGASATTPWSHPDGGAGDAGEADEADGGAPDGGLPETPVTACLYIGGLDRVHLHAEAGSGCVLLGLVNPGGPSAFPDLTLPEGWGLERLAAFPGPCPVENPWEDLAGALAVAGVVALGETGEWGYPLTLHLDLVVTFAEDAPLGPEVRIRASDIPVEEFCW